MGNSGVWLLELGAAGLPARRKPIAATSHAQAIEAFAKHVTALGILDLGFAYVRLVRVDPHGEAVIVDWRM